MIKEDENMKTKRYEFTFYARRNNKNLQQAETFVNELKLNHKLYVFKEKDLSEYIKYIREQERKAVCDMIEAQMATEVFCDGEFTPHQFTNTIFKVRRGGPYEREWKYFARKKGEQND